MADSKKARQGSPRAPAAAQQPSMGPLAPLAQEVLTARLKSLSHWLWLKLAVGVVLGGLFVVEGLLVVLVGVGGVTLSPQP
jgi:hypothetical protein